MTGETTEFRFVGEHLALDFVNTETTEGDAVSDALPTFADAVAWFKAGGVLRTATARALLQFDGTRQAAEALSVLRAFRTVLRDMLDHYRTRGTIGERFVDEINRQLQECGCTRALVREGDGYAVRAQYHFERPLDLLMPVANAAAELLAEVDLTRVKRCGSDCCDMYFLDTSRNRSRTWCDMASCGNRAKAAAYYERSRARRFTTVP